MNSAVIWVIIVILSLFIAFSLWCCLAINKPQTEAENRKAFQEDCKEFDAYMERRQPEGGKTK